MSCLQNKGTSHKEFSAKKYRILERFVKNFVIFENVKNIEKISADAFRGCPNIVLLV